MFNFSGELRQIHEEMKVTYLESSNGQFTFFLPQVFLLKY